MKKHFTRDYLVDVLDLPYSDMAIEREIVGHYRWSIQYALIFKDDDGTFWRTTYQVGATESQSEEPWEYLKEIECTQVEKREVLVEKWLPID